MNTRNLSRVLVVAALLLIAAPAFAAGPYQFFALTPCRVIDTRAADGPIMTGGTTRSFKIRGVCGLPSDATAVAINVTVFQPSAKGHVRAWPSDIAIPFASILNFAGGETALANGAIVPLAANSGDPTDISFFLFTATPGTSHLLADVTGYFK
jgi:hypothetical protein